MNAWRQMLSLFVCCFLVTCKGEEHGTLTLNIEEGKSTLQGKIWDGPVVDAQVGLRHAKTNAILKNREGQPVSGRSDSTGQFRLEFVLPEDWSGQPIIVESRGGTDSGGNQQLDSNDLAALALNGLTRYSNQQGNNQTILTGVTSLVAAKVMAQPELPPEQAVREIAQTLSLTPDQILADPQSNPNTAQVSAAVVLTAMMSKVSTGQAVDELQLYQALVQSNEPIVTAYQDRKGIALNNEVIAQSLVALGQPASIAQQTQTALQGSQELITVLAQQAGNRASSQGTSDTGKQIRAEAVWDAGVQSLQNVGKQIHEYNGPSRGQQQVMALTLSSAAQKTLDVLLQTPAASFSSLDRAGYQTQISTAQLGTIQSALLVQVTRPLLADTNSLLGQAAQTLSTSTLANDSTLSLQTIAAVDSLANLTSSLAKTNTSLNLELLQEVAKVNVQLIRNSIDEAFLQSIALASTSQGLANAVDSLKEAAALSTAANIADCVDLSLSADYFRQLQNEAAQNQGVGMLNCVGLARRAAQTMVETVVESAKKDPLVLNLLNAPSTLEPLVQAVVLPSTKTAEEIFTLLLTSQQITQSAQEQQGDLTASIQNSRQEILVADVPFTGLLGSTVNTPTETGTNPAPPTTTTTTLPAGNTPTTTAQSTTSAPSSSTTLQSNTTTSTTLASSTSSTTSVSQSSTTTGNASSTTTTLLTEQTTTTTSSTVLQNTTQIFQTLPPPTSPPTSPPSTSPPTTVPNRPPGNVTASLAAGNYGQTQTVTLSCVSSGLAECSKIYYTLDGSQPTAQSAVYVTPLLLAQSVTLKFYAVNQKGVAGPVTTVAYLIDTQPPAVNASLPEGAYRTAQTLKLTCSDAGGAQCDKIYYTLDGSTPGLSSAIYDQPLVVAQTLILRFIANDTLGNLSPVQSRRYIVDAQAPLVNASIPSGLYRQITPITLACQDGSGSGCEQIYYAFGNDLATTASSLYRTPLKISQNTTLSFLATDLAGNVSLASSVSYRLDNLAPTLAASPLPGFYNSDQNLVLLCSDRGGSTCANIYYTLDGSEPNLNSEVFSDSLTLSETQTVKARAIDSLGNLGEVQSFTYTLDKNVPVVKANPAPGYFTQAFTINWSCTDTQNQACAAIYYTTDGNDPTLASTTYRESFGLQESRTFKVKGRDSAGNFSALNTLAYIIDGLPPVARASVESGIYTNDQAVSLTCQDQGESGCAAIYLTTDGSAATTQSTLYSAPLYLSAPTVVRFIAQDRAGNWSQPLTKNYIIDKIPPSIAASPNGAVYGNTVNVQLTCQDQGSGCQDIYFTLDGTEPTPQSNRYQAPLSLAQNTVLKYQAFDQAGLTSSVGSEKYIIDRTGPVVSASVESGLYNRDQDVTLVCKDRGGGQCAGIYYTTDGTPATTASTLYTKSVSVTQNMTLKYLAQDKNGNLSEMQTRNYVIDKPHPAARASLASGAYSQNTTVALVCTDSTGDDCARIYYTLNGQDPTSASFIYTEPIAITQNLTLKFFGVSMANVFGAIDSRVYTMDALAPSVTPVPAPGIANTAMSVELSCGDTGGSGCEAIYYTSDGTTPSVRSAIYSSALKLLSSTKLRVFALDKAGNTFQANWLYLIDTNPPKVEVKPSEVYQAPNTAITLTCNDTGGSECDKLYYTLDGTPPSSNSILYNGPFNLTQNANLRAIAFDKAGNKSEEQTQNYLLDGTSPQVTSTPTPDIYTTPQTFTLSCDDGNGSGCQTVYYTTDGSSPTTDSNIYTKPLILAQNTTLQVMALDKLGNASVPQTLRYIIDTNPPVSTANPAGGTFNRTVNLSLSCQDDSEQCSIYYTLDGSTPTQTSSRYTSILALTQSSTVSYRAYDTVGNSEIAQTQTYTIDRSKAVIKASPDGGAYNSAQNIALTCRDPEDKECATIYYGLGQTANTYSPIYSGPVSLNASNRLAYLGIASDNLTQGSGQSTYVIDSIAPELAVTPLPGIFGKPPQVSWTCRDQGGSGCALSQYYTLDDSAPGITSALYQSALPLVGSAILRVYAPDLAGNTPDFRFEYIVDQIAPALTTTPQAAYYKEEVTPELICNDSGGSNCDKIFYTSDGNEPTTNSNIAAEALRFSETTTLKVRANDFVGNLSEVFTWVFGVDRKAPQVKSSAEEGFYNTDILTTLTCTDTGGSGCDKIYYTLDGSVPTLASSIYVETLTLSQSTTLNAIVSDKAGNLSKATKWVYLIDRDSPAVRNSPASGAYSGRLGVKLECSDAGGSECERIYYTSDGSEPTLQSSVYQGTLALTQTTVLKFLGTDRAGNLSPTQTRNFVVDSVPPKLKASLAAGVYGSPQKVELTCDDNFGSGCATIFFTTNGTIPYDQSSVYVEAISVNHSMNLQAVALDVAGNLSEVLTVPYLLDRTPPTVTPSIAGGVYGTTQTLRLDCHDQGGGQCATIYYTLDGSDNPSTLYHTPLVLEQSARLSFLGVDTLGNTSPISAQTYTIDRQGPLLKLNPAPGAFNKDTEISLTCQDLGGSQCSRIYLTTDGSLATTATPSWTKPRLLIQQTTVINAFAVDDLGNVGERFNGTYTIERNKPLLKLTPPPGLYSIAQTVTLSCVDSKDGICAAIYYTTDASQPTALSQAYTLPLPLQTQTTLKALGQDSLGNLSEVQGGEYRFDMQAPTATASVPAGVYGEALTVELGCLDAGGSGCSQLYYTFDGSDPSPLSVSYTTPLTIRQSTLLKVLARDEAGNFSPILSRNYIIDLQGPNVAASPSGGISAQAFQVSLTCQDSGGSECADIYYTLDGFAPTIASLRYQGPLTLAQDTVLQYVALDRVGNASEVQQQIYRVDQTPPRLNLSGPTLFGKSLEVTLGCEDEVAGCETLFVEQDGTEPTIQSPNLAPGSRLTLTQPSLLKLLARDKAGNISTVYTQTYLQDLMPPALLMNVDPGQYNTVLNLQVTCHDLGAAGCDQVYYTLGESTPTLASSVFPQSLTLGETDGTYTLNLIGVDRVGNMSKVQSFAYLIDRTKPAVQLTAEPKREVYQSSQTVTVQLTCTDPGGAPCAKVYYTLDGSTPTTNSALYTQPLPLTGTQPTNNQTSTLVLKFIGVDQVGNQSPLGQKSLSFDYAPPILDMSQLSQTIFDQSASITLQCQDNLECTALKYTIDGNDPLNSGESVPNTANLKFTNSTTVRVVTFDSAGYASREQKLKIQIDKETPQLTFSPLPGSYETDQTLQVSCTDDIGCKGFDYTVSYDLNGNASSTRYTTSGALLSGPAQQKTTFTVTYNYSDLVNKQGSGTVTYTIDKSPLYVLASTPNSGSQVSAATSPFSLTFQFNKPIQLPTSNQVTLANSLNQVIPVALSLSNDQQTLSVKALQTIPATTYTAVVRNIAASGSSQSLESFGVTFRALAGLPAIKLILSDIYSCAIVNTGQVYCWGFFQAKKHTAEETGLAPLERPVIDGAMQIPGYCAVLDDGRIQCWDRNSMLVTQTYSGPTRQISMGLANNNQPQYHACMALNDGQVQCFGNNYFKQLGVATQKEQGPVNFQLSSTIKVAQMAAANNNSCALSEKGEVQCWGNNGYARTTTIQLAGSAVALTHGQLHYCALMQEGSVKCWGTNTSGQLGSGNISPVAPPYPSVNLGAPARQVAGGSLHTCAVLIDDTLKCWGKNNNGQLGLGNSTQQNSPQAVNVGAPVWKVSAGSNITCVILYDGSVKCWGQNTFYQIGSITTEANVGSTTATTPEKLAAFYPALGFPTAPTALATTASFTDTSSKASTLAGTLSLTAATTELGLDGYSIYWGATPTQKLGNTPLFSLPSGQSTWQIQLAFSGLSWASTAMPEGARYLLVYSRTGSHESPQALAVTINDWKIETPTALQVVSYSPANEAGDVPLQPLISLRFNTATCGCNIATTVLPEIIFNKRQVDSLTTEFYLTDRSLQPSTRYTFTVKKTTQSESGLQMTEDLSWSFTTVSNVAKPTRVTGGQADSCALLLGGQIKCWGDNRALQLGLGDNRTRGLLVGDMGDALPPLNLGNSGEAVQVVSGANHHCALFASGAVACWGDNNYGQSGVTNKTIVEVSGQTPIPGQPTPSNVVTQPSPANVATPTLIDLGSGQVKQLSAGAQHTCALMRNGEVKCWGLNSSGQLGMGDSVSRGRVLSEMGNGLPTVNLGSGRTAVQLTSGANHTCALLDNASVKCWGANNWGQLGLPW